MSKKFVNKPDKNVYVPNIIPSNFRDEIYNLAKAGEYGKLEQKLELTPSKISYDKDNQMNDIIHIIIKSDFTETQKCKIIDLLLKKGVSINALDLQNLPAIYYAVKEQLVEVTQLLIDKNANIKIKLPAGYDLFQAALTPHIGKCPIKMSNLVDKEYMSKYYSQTMVLERKFKSEIYKLPEIVTYIQSLIDLIEKSDTYKLEFYTHTESGNDIIKSIYNVIDDDENNVLPSFNNTVYTNVRDIPKKIYDALKSTDKENLNEDQIRLKLATLRNSLINDIRKFLGVTYATTIPELNLDKIYEYINDKKDIQKIFDTNDYINLDIYNNFNNDIIIIKYKIELRQIYFNFNEDIEKIDNAIQKIENEIPKLVGSSIGVDPINNLKEYRNDINKIFILNVFDLITNIKSINDIDKLFQSIIQNILKNYDKLLKGIQNISNIIIKNYINSLRSINNINNNNIYDKIFSEINNIKDIIIQLYSKYKIIIKSYNKFIIDNNNIDYIINNNPNFNVLMFPKYDNNKIDPGFIIAKKLTFYQPFIIPNSSYNHIQYIYTKYYKNITKY